MESRRSCTNNLGGLYPKSQAHLKDEKHMKKKKIEKIVVGLCATRTNPCTPRVSGRLQRGEKWQFP